HKDSLAGKTEGSLVGKTARPPTGKTPWIWLGRVANGAVPAAVPSVFQGCQEVPSVALKRRRLPSGAKAWSASLPPETGRDEVPLVMFRTWLVPPTVPLLYQRSLPVEPARK